MNSGLDIVWPKQDCTRVPFELFFDEELYQLELERIFGGPHWQYLALEQEIPNPGDYVTTYLGERRVVVTRGPDAEIYAFENRCAHRGAQVVNRLRGNAARFNCPYHLWCYDHAGNLLAVSQEKGVKGKGGMPDDFDRTRHSLRKLNVARYKNLIFGTFADEIMSLETYIGPTSLQQIDRIMSRPVGVLGYYRQVVEANWKLLANMIGPAGFISMEDGEAARLVQQAARTQRRQFAFVEMGGRGEVKDQDHLVQEVAIRGFWQYYRKVMQFRGDGADGR